MFLLVNYRFDLAKRFQSYIEKNNQNLKLTKKPRQ
jgi:preprotein translocase subunit Sss1